MAIVAGDAPFLVSKPFLQRMGAVLDLEQGQVMFNKLGVTLNLEESATGHYVIDLISGCADSTTDESTREHASSSGKRSRNESWNDSEDAVGNSEFSNLICRSEKVTVIDLSKPRVSLVGVDCEKSCRLWTIGNFVSDDSIFVVKDECPKKQQMILPAPWTGRTVIEGKYDEFVGHVMHLTQSEELLIQKSCDKSWRGAECKLVQPRILAMKTGPHGRKHRTFQEEEGFFIFGSFDAWPLLNCVDFLLILSLFILLMCCRLSVSLKSQQKARNMCNHVCSVVLEL